MPHLRVILLLVMLSASIWNRSLGAETKGPQRVIFELILEYWTILKVQFGGGSASTGKPLPGRGTRSPVCLRFFKR